MRTLTSAIALGSFVVAAPGLAQEQEQEQEEDRGVVDFAPGSTGRITAPLATIVDDAKRRGEAMREELQPLAPAENAFEDVDFDNLREKALNNPRVRSLMGVGDESGSGAGDEDQRYEGSRVFLLASFSMPKESLRQMMSEANTYGLPIIFRGFVNNSIYETQAALEDVFGSVEGAVGYSIDPTVFTRFDVSAVPQVIAVQSDLDVCETHGCEDDPVPPHDRVKGNVPLDFALRLIAKNGDVAADEARRLLGE
ncbi:type-F conjugative transfer system pilin assembly protein TrbC [uncultured Tateyamaria sp.]|uniref:type-F conjugative transfer system pilin assembly protein TrbC n=1 Tax=uncultured Tateyamaria sp. TaxID=455651 RepID=UPI002636DFFB|nr:type-F conjugative transfer system pilin assembly protein TrbC [uncultured Tateyamaria sp.]